MEIQQDIAGDADVSAAVAEQDVAQEEPPYDPASFYDEEGQGEAEDEAQPGAEDEDDEGADGADAGEGAAAAESIEAPHSWSKEDKAIFAKLDPAAQSVVLRRETERDNFVKQKAFEASQTRQQVETQAREVIAKLYDDQVQKLQVYAQQILPPPPDRNLLYSNDPNEVFQYHRQKDAYDAAADQQRELHQQIANAQAQANSAREQSQQAERASDAQRLKEQLPDWFDPSSGPKLQTELQSIGAELGYPAELMAEASSTDIIALKKASEWKAKAAKYDALMSKKMSAVSRARQLPKITARPGNGAAQPTSDPVKLLYPND